MAQTDNTAERELLKVIEGTEGKSKFVKKLKVSPNADPFALVSSRLSFFVNKVKTGSSSGVLSPSLGQLNKLITGVILLFIVWYFLVLANGAIRLQHIPRFTISSLKSTAGSSDGVILPLKDYHYYKDVLLGRNIFNPVEKKEIKKPTDIVSPRIDSMIKDFKIVGISWAEDTKDRYVMIEDTKAQLTYYLQEGDKISNLKIKSIFEDKAVLSYNEEEVELR
ncbi:hypothetical protein ACFL1E_06690 [Candidatus Omnitrophota bacterium]